MKIRLVILVTLSSSAFAIDFNKVTGTFDLKQEKTPEFKDTLATAGTFDPEKTDSRKPASTEKDPHNEQISEASGSFR
jgi:hypothetical protein